MKVLLVDSDGARASALAGYLSAHDGHAARWTTRPAELLEPGELDEDVIVLRDELVDAVGRAVASRLRSSGYRGGVILLAEALSNEDLAAALRGDVDDVVRGAVSHVEIAARVWAVGRRCSSVEVVRYDGFEVDVRSKSVTYAGRELGPLTPREIELFAALARRRGQPLPARELGALLWEQDEARSDRARVREVNVAIHRLRCRLGDDEDLLETVRGFGYRLRARRAGRPDR
ncbi:MAG: response regulator transcription factor [Myxococcales bacterium]|nr:response regulator transcription factor [Myxococcales bacterium]